MTSWFLHSLRAFLNVRNYSLACIFFEMMEHFHVDKRYYKNLTTSLFLCFYAFFTMLLNLKPGDFLQFWLFIILFVGSLNNINNNIYKAGFFIVPKSVLQSVNPSGYPVILIDPRNTNHICHTNDVIIDSCEILYIP